MQVASLGPTIKWMRSSNSRSVRHVFCCCSDGAGVMVKAIQQLKIGGHFPNLRFQFRDAAHSTNCVGKHAEKHANPENEVKELLITGEASFVKRIRYQTSAKDDWKKVGGGDSDCYEHLLDLAAAPHRWPTTSKAKSALCLKIIKVIKMIVLWPTFGFWLRNMKSHSHTKTNTPPNKCYEAGAQGCNDRAQR